MGLGFYSVCFNHKFNFSNWYGATQVYLFLLEWAICFSRNLLNLLKQKFIEFFSFSICRIIMMSPLSFLILLFWIFSFFLINLTKGLSILFIFSKYQLLVLLIFFITLPSFYFIAFCSGLYYSFLLFMLVSFSNFIRWQLRFLTWQILICSVFGLFKICSNFLFSSFTHRIFRSVIFNFHLLGDFPDIFLLLFSSLILLWSENELGMTSILLNSLFSFALWPKICFILLNILCAFEMNVPYFLLLLGWVFLINVRSSWLIVFFKFSIIFLIVYLF